MYNRGVGLQAPVARVTYGEGYFLGSNYIELSTGKGHTAQQERQKMVSDADGNERTILPTSSGVPGSTTHAGSCSLDATNWDFPTSYEGLPVHA